MCKSSLHRAFLYQAHLNALVRLLSCTRVGAACPRHFQRTNVMGAASPPLTALLVVRLHLQPSSAPSPGSQKEPSSGGGERTSTRLAPAVAERGAEEQKTQRRLPFRKRQPTTPQKKTLFPSVSLQRNGRGGPAVAPILSTKNGLSVHRIGELGANSALCRQTQQHLFCSLALGLKKWNSKSMWKTKQNKTYQQQCFISCTQFMCVFLLFLVRNHYE